MYDGMRLMSIFRESRTPICTMIDGYSASAATFLTMLAPYRVMTKYSICLLHQYNASVWGTRELLHNYLNNWDNMYAHVREMYLRMSTIKTKDLDELLRHDLWLPSEVCLANGMVERVLDCSNVNMTEKVSNHALSTNQLLKKTNFNTMYVECDGGLLKIDEYLRNDENIKPILFHPASIATACTEGFMFNGMAMIPRIEILSARIPTYSILDSIITMDEYLPMLYCTKRMMYEHAFISINLLHFNMHQLIFSDMVHNRGVLLNQIKEILQKKTKVPRNLIENIDKKLILLNAKECLKYKLCDEIIYMN
jgi:ATP-dependent protease ClpP protease subunit